MGKTWSIPLVYPLKCYILLSTIRSRPQFSFISQTGQNGVHFTSLPDQALYSVIYHKKWTPIFILVEYNTLVDLNFHLFHRVGKTWSIPLVYPLKCYILLSTIRSRPQFSFISQTGQNGVHFTSLPDQALYSVIYHKKWTPIFIYFTEWVKRGLFY